MKLLKRIYTQYQKWEETEINIDLGFYYITTNKITTLILLLTLTLLLLTIKFQIWKQY